MHVLLAGKRFPGAILWRLLPNVKKHLSDVVRRWPVRTHAHFGESGAAFSGQPGIGQRFRPSDPDLLSTYGGCVLHDAVLENAVMEAASTLGEDGIGEVYRQESGLMALTPSTNEHC